MAQLYIKAPSTTLLGALTTACGTAMKRMWLSVLLSLKRRELYLYQLGSLKRLGIWAVCTGVEKTSRKKIQLCMVLCPMACIGGS